MAATVWCVKKWPWWAWLAIGVVGGVAAATAVLEWTSIDDAAIWSADLAMQGWGGAVLGAVASIAVAVFVLYVQRRADDERFALAREDDRRRAELEEARLRRQLKAEQRASREARMVAAWTEFASSLQRAAYLPTPRELADARAQATELWVAWCMHLRRRDNDFASDIIALTLSCFDNLEKTETAGKRALIVADVLAMGLLWHRGERERAEIMAREQADLVRPKESAQA
jgi:hypothetical protein